MPTQPPMPPGPLSRPSASVPPMPPPPTGPPVSDEPPPPDAPVNDSWDPPPGMPPLPGAEHRLGIDDPERDEEPSGPPLPPDTMRHDHR